MKSSSFAFRRWPLKLARSAPALASHKSHRSHESHPPPHPRGASHEGVEQDPARASEHPTANGKLPTANPSSLFLELLVQIFLHFVVLAFEGDDEAAIFHPGNTADPVLAVNDRPFPFSDFDPEIVGMK